MKSNAEAVIILQRLQQDLDHALGRGDDELIFVSRARMERWRDSLALVAVVVSAQRST